MKTIYERNTLVEKHMDLAESLARRRHRTIARTITYDELLSAAYLGLIDASEKFNEERVNEKSTKPFECYARKRIIGEMNDYLRSQNWGTRANPQKVYSIYNRIATGVRADSGSCIETDWVSDYIRSKEVSVIDKLNGVELFDRIIQSLSSREKTIFKLRFIHELTMKEIADVTDLSESRISQILSDNMIYLQKIWNIKFDDLWSEAAIRS